MPGVFLSHNQRDKAFVRMLGDDLRAHGIRVWIDEAEMLVGDSLLDKIASAVLEMDFLAVVLSPESVVSPWVREELKLALQAQIESQRVRVLPILLRDCEIPPFLRGRVFADFRNEGEYAQALEDLVRSICAHAERASAPTDAKDHSSRGTTAVALEPSISSLDNALWSDEVLALGMVVAFATGFWQVNHVLHWLMKQTDSETAVDVYLGAWHLIVFGIVAATLYRFAKHRVAVLVASLLVLPVLASLAVGEWRGRHSVSAMAFFFMQAVVSSLLVLVGSSRRDFQRLSASHGSTPSDRSVRLNVLRERAHALWLASLIGSVLVVICGAMMPVAIYLAPASVFTWPIEAAERQLLAMLFGMATLVLFAECVLLLWPKAQLLRAQSKLLH